MSKLLLESDDFSLEFDTSDFKRVYGKARSNIPVTSLVSFYAVEGVEATVKLDASDEQMILHPSNTPVEDILANGVRSRKDGHAFFFDNVEYNVWLELKPHCSHAEIVHATKVVEQSLASRNNGRVLYGTIKTGNDVGRFDFAFVYERMENGAAQKRQFVFTFEILSQKLDYHKDWRTLVEDIEGRYPMLAYDFLRRTYHAFDKSYEENDATNLVWWNLFERLQRPFVKACRLIVERPRRRLRGSNEYRRADQLTRLDARTENEFAEFAYEPSHLYLVERNADTHDTLENRFVKFALTMVLRRYEKLHRAILERDRQKDQHKLSDAAKTSMSSMESELRQLARNPFFRRVGSFTGLRQLSLTLQRAPGYSVVYRTYAILNAAYMIHEGMNKMETKDIADLYEIWCFLKVEEYTAAALPNGTIKTPSGINGDDFVKLLSTGLQSTVVFRSTTGVELARVVYNPQIKDSPKPQTTGVDGTVTPTSLTAKSSQDPDIVLRLTNSDIGGYQVTYLFDAKYRLEDIKGTHAGAPPQDAIDQMHRYRDAIYYADVNQIGAADPFVYKKEIVGGYILFPGKGKIDLEAPANNAADTRPSYIKSIDKVNIGALPLRPNDAHNADVLKKFIERLVNGRTDLDSVLGRVNPQKGAILSVATETAIFDATVYGTYHGKTQLDWIKKNRYYNLPVDAAKTLGITPTYANKKKLLALLPPGRSPTEELLVFTIDAQVPCRLVTKAELLDPNGPYKYNGSGNHAPYLVWRLKNTDPITRRIPKIKIVSGGQTGVDQGALEVADSLGLDFGGWAPSGWIADNGTIPVVFQQKMKECPNQGSNAQNYRERTKANVRDSQATLILVERLPLEGGTKMTKAFAASIGRSHHVVDLSAGNAKVEALKWLRQFLGKVSPFVLNVAGPRESKAPGIQAKTKAFLSEVLWEV